MNIPTDILGYIFNKSEVISQIISFFSNFPSLKTIRQTLKDLFRLINRASGNGMYEVINYESTLELKDNYGKKAIFKKFEEVRYLQDNIIAYQDQAWGDGRILLNYRCSPGIPVDHYRSGFKTHILISLREVKNKGNINNFNIMWGIHQGFLAKTCFWTTDVSHITKLILVKIIFPRERPPLLVSIVESNSQKTHSLEENCKVQLPDGRWMVSWSKKQPKLHEQYILKWEW